MCGSVKPRDFLDRRCGDDARRVHVLKGTRGEVNPVAQRFGESSSSPRQYAEEYHREVRQH